MSRAMTPVSGRVIDRGSRFIRGPGARTLRETFG